MLNLSTLYIFISPEIKNCKECFVLPEAEWHIDEFTIFVPDVMVVCNEDIEGAYVENTPLIIFEILSKSTAKKDRNLKKFKYQEAKVKYYIIVDGDLKKVNIFELNQDKDKYIEKELNKFELDNCSIEFDFNLIFE